MSPNWPRILGHPVAEIWGRNISQILHPDDLEACRRHIAQVYHTGQPQGVIEYRVQHANGEWRWHFTNGAPLLDEQGNVSSFLGSSHAITPLREMEQKVLHLAQHDSLTDLPNRAIFFSQLSDALVKSQRQGDSLALLFIDLDNFKPVNDRWGPAVGDQLLREVAQRMRLRLRGTDMVGRIGGDEFVALLGGPVRDDEALAVGESALSGVGRAVCAIGRGGWRVGEYRRGAVSASRSGGSGADSLCRPSNVSGESGGSSPGGALLADWFNGCADVLKHKVERGG